MFFYVQGMIPGDPRRLRTCIFVVRTQFSLAGRNLHCQVIIFIVRAQFMRAAVSLSYQICKRGSRSVAQTGLLGVRNLGHMYHILLMRKLNHTYFSCSPEDLKS